MKKAMVLMGLLYAIEVHAVCHSNEERVTYDITTGSSKGTYFEIGLNLAKYVAPDACINLKIRTSKGSLDNAFKLNSKEEKNVFNFDRNQNPKSKVLSCSLI